MRFRLALLLALPSATSLMADDSYIVQPRLRASIEQQTLPIQQPNRSAQGAMTSANHLTSTSPNSLANQSPPPASTTAQRAYFQPISPTVARPSNAANTQELQWFTRGTAPRPTGHVDVRTISTMDLRIDNPQSIEFEQIASGPQPDQMTLAADVPPSISLDAEIAQQKQASAPDATEATPLSPVDLQRQEREVLASLISSRIVGQNQSSEQSAPRRTTEAVPGWHAIGERLTRHMQNCETLLRRNAFFSAREEAEAGAVYLVRVLDLMSNNYSSEPLLLAAQQALHESEDFTFSQRLTTDQNFLQRLIESHQTSVLKEVDVGQLSPLVAAQHYRQYASDCLVQACQSHPWASEVYYMLGRTFQAQAEVSPSNSDGLRWRAVTFYQAAVAISPSNSIASNQLGFILLQMDRAQDARAALVASVEANWNEPALENLVEASRRLNDGATQQWAMQNLAAMRQGRPNLPPAPQVTEVDPRTFIALSPYSIGPHSPLPSDGAARAASAPHAAMHR